MDPSVKRHASRFSDCDEKNIYTPKFSMTLLLQEECIFCYYVSKKQACNAITCLGAWVVMISDPKVPYLLAYIKLLFC